MAMLFDTKRHNSVPGGRFELNLGPWNQQLQPFLPPVASLLSEIKEFVKAC